MTETNSGDLERLLATRDRSDPKFIRLLEDMRRHGHEIELLKKAPKGDLMLDKTTPYAAFGMKVLLVEKNAERAITLFEKGLEQKPNDPHAHLGLGLAYNQVGDRTKADNHYTNALRIGGDTWAMRAVAYAGRGGTRFGLCRPGDGFDDCSKALEIDPKCDIAYQNMAVFYQQLGNHRAAMTWWKVGLREIPNSSRLAFGMAGTLLELGDHQLAEEVAKTIDPQYEVERTALLKEAIRKAIDGKPTSKDHK